MTDRRLANSLIESIRSAKNKKTNLADPIIAAIKGAVINREPKITRNWGGGNNNYREPKITRNWGGGNNNYRQPKITRNWGGGNNNYRQPKITRNWGGGNNNYRQPKITRNWGGGNNNVSIRSRISYHNNNSRNTRVNFNKSTPRFENNRENVNRQTTRSFNSANNRGTPSSNTVNMKSMPRFENDSPGTNANSSLRGTHSFENRRVLRSTKPLHPGVGLKILQDVLETTPKKYLKRVIKREASDRRAKKLLPSKKKFLVQFLQKEIRPRKRKSSARVLV